MGAAASSTFASGSSLTTTSAALHLTSHLQMPRAPCIASILPVAHVLARYLRHFGLAQVSDLFSGCMCISLVRQSFFHFCFLLFMQR